jgi:putative ABC transport system permease protein
MTWSGRWRRRLRAVVRRAAVEGELQEELEFHLEMEIEKNLRAGMGPEEARRQAYIAFGGVEGHKEAVREARWFGWVHGLSLDLRLGVRMLARYPGLTLVAGVAIAVATGLGAAVFQFSAIYNPSWPFPEPDRVVAIRIWDPEKAAPERRSSYEVGIWRERARSLELLGAVVQRKDLALVTEGGSSEVVDVAQIGAQALAIPRVPPLLGRPLLEDDERPGAPPVVVVAYDVWQRLYGGDPRVLGQTVRVGAEPATLVGVMPEGFRFPLNQEAWLSLPRDPLASGPREGPPVQILGRLARGVSTGEAEAELAALAAADPLLAAAGAAEPLSPQVMTLSDAFFGSAVRWAVYGARVLFLLLMGALCVNVATLVFARTAMRGGEIAVRSALGASRRRIATQMFLEGLVLAAVPSAIGLAAAAWAFPRVMTLFWRVQEMAPPFWAHGRVSVWTAAYVGGLAVFGAVVIGVVPALQATGRRLQPHLSRLATGSSGLRFGGVWTVAIVVQVAISVALLPFAVMEARSALRDAARSSGFPAAHVLTGRISHDAAAADPAAAELRSRRALLFEEARRRIASEPGVAGVAFAGRVPGLNHPVSLVQIDDGAGSADGEARSLRRLDIDEGFLDLLGAVVVSGRPLQAGDYGSEDGHVLVNEEFARELTGGRDPVGMRIRYTGESGEEEPRWYPIAGVVRDLDMDAFGPGVHRAVYHPLRPGAGEAVQAFVRLTEPTPSAGPRLSGVVARIDPALQVSDLRTVGETWQPAHTAQRLLAVVWAAVAAITLLLAMAGIHAMMSFAVSQRTREIGIRSALGAGPGRIAAAIFARALAQVGLGVLLGWLLASGAVWSNWSSEGPAVLLTVGGIVLTAGLLACFRPARRALRIQPTEALKLGG